LSVLGMVPGARWMGIDFYKMLREALRVGRAWGGRRASTTPLEHGGTPNL